jgi:UDP-N-acetylglucosamine 2-epimerase
MRRDPLKVLSVVGARPEFVQVSTFAKAVESRGGSHVLIHTGQHYDPELSATFFSELGLQEPQLNLGVGSAERRQQIDSMVSRLVPVIAAERPDRVAVFGDTNSTLAGAIGAKECGAYLAHVEAGLRCGDRNMPEEMNRIEVDRISDLLLCPGERALDNLRAEGVTGDARVVGDVMLDALGETLRRPDPQVARRWSLEGGRFVFATIHRAQNTDDPVRLSAMLQGLGRATDPVVIPLHPRTAAAIQDSDIRVSTNIRLVAPISHTEAVSLIKSARVVATDSGGLQKEAYWLGVPCVTLRETTEWVETVEAGWNTLVGADPDAITAAVASPASRRERPPLYGEPGASMRCAEALGVG